MEDDNMKNLTDPLKQYCELLLNSGFRVMIPDHRFSHCNYFFFQKESKIGYVEHCEFFDEGAKFRFYRISRIREGIRFCCKIDHEVAYEFPGYFCYKLTLEEAIATLTAAPAFNGYTLENLRDTEILRSVNPRTKSDFLIVEPYK